MIINKNYNNHKKNKLSAKYSNNVDKFLLKYSQEDISKIFLFLAIKKKGGRIEEYRLFAMSMEQLMCCVSETKHLRRLVLC